MWDLNRNEQILTFKVHIFHKNRPKLFYPDTLFQNLRKIVLGLLKNNISYIENISRSGPGSTTSQKPSCGVRIVSCGFQLRPAVACGGLRCPAVSCGFQAYRVRNVVQLEIYYYCYVCDSLAL